VYLQDIETEGNMKEEECDNQDIKEEIPHSKFLATTALILEVRQSCR